MNLIPFVTLLILVFSFYSMTFHDYEKELFEDERNFQSEYFITLKGQNEVKSRQFYRLKAKEATTSSEQQLPTEIKKILRKNMNLEDRAKLNLWILVNEEEHPSYQILYQFTARLIKELYKRATFYKKDLEYEILDHFIAKMKSKEEESDEPIFDNLIGDGLMFYKMVKGVSGYDLEKSFGYPPLEEFFCLESGSRKPLNFQYATPLVLNTFFGDNVFNEVLEKEKSKELDNFLNEKELEEVLVNHFSDIKDPSLYKDLLHFGTVKENHSLYRIKDKATNVTITYNLDE